MGYDPFVPKMFQVYRPGTDEPQFIAPLGDTNAIISIVARPLPGQPFPLDLELHQVSRCHFSLNGETGDWVIKRVF